MPCAQVLPKPVQIQSFLVLKSGHSDVVEQARNSLGYYFFPREALKNTEQNIRNRVMSNVTFQLRCADMHGSTSIRGMHHKKKGASVWFDMDQTQ